MYFKILVIFIFKTLFMHNEYNIKNKYFNLFKVFTIIVLIFNLFFIIYLLKKLLSIYIIIKKKSS